MTPRIDPRAIEKTKRWLLKPTEALQNNRRWRHHVPETKTNAQACVSHPKTNPSISQKVVKRWRHPSKMGGDANEPKRHTKRHQMTSGDHPKAPMMLLECLPKASKTRLPGPQKHFLAQMEETQPKTRPAPKTSSGGPTFPSLPGLTWVYIYIY